MSEMQTKVDEWKFLGEHGSAMYQVPNECLSAQTGEFTDHN